MGDSKSKKHLLHLAQKVSVLVLTTVISYLTLLLVCLRDTRDEHGYLAAQLDKVELLKNTPSPRLVLVGGSNLAFGVDSAELSKAIGLPVVNMGLHASLGLRWMLDCTTSLLRKGDVVVVIPEYEEFTGETFDGDELLVQMFAFSPDLNTLRRLSPSMLLKANSVIFTWTPGGTTAAAAGARREFGYTRDGFNRNGDEVSHLAFANVPIRSQTRMNANLNRRAVNSLATFIEEQNRSGVTAIFVFPCLMKTRYQENQVTISRIAGELKKHIPQRSMVPDEFVDDDQYFFNTPYHLNAEGRKRRTDKLVEVLNRSSREGGWHR